MNQDRSSYELLRNISNLAGRQLVSTKVKMEDTGEHLSYLNKSLDVTRTDLKSIQLQKRLKVSTSFYEFCLGSIIP